MTSNEITDLVPVTFIQTTSLPLSHLFHGFTAPRITLQKKRKLYFYFFKHLYFIENLWILLVLAYKSNLLIIILIVMMMLFFFETNW